MVILLSLLLLQMPSAVAVAAVVKSRVFKSRVVEDDVGRGRRHDDVGDEAGVRVMVMPCLLLLRPTTMVVVILPLGGSTTTTTRIRRITPTTTRLWCIRRRITTIRPFRRRTRCRTTMVVVVATTFIPARASRGAAEAARSWRAWPSTAIASLGTSALTSTRWTRAGAPSARGALFVQALESAMRVAPRRRLRRTTTTS